MLGNVLNPFQKPKQLPQDDRRLSKAAFDPAGLWIEWQRTVRLSVGQPTRETVHTASTTTKA